MSYVNVIHSAPPAWLLHTTSFIYASSSQKQYRSLGQQVLLRCDKSHNCWIVTQQASQVANQ
uniref:Uncharacterized protein n=1 Tax=Glossina palpalis gambiensis TaxID=67801 RepID=A0A1B0BGN9_9MUSC